LAGEHHKHGRNEKSEARAIASHSQAKTPGKRGRERFHF
jgi:hypothetical protein